MDVNPKEKLLWLDRSGVDRGEAFDLRGVSVLICSERDVDIVGDWERSAWLLVC